MGGVVFGVRLPDRLLGGCKMLDLRPFECPLCGRLIGDERKRAYHICLKHVTDCDHHCGPMIDWFATHNCPYVHSLIVAKTLEALP